MKPFLKQAILTAARIFIRPRGREAFIARLPHKACVLDVGCGGNSPLLVKSQRPDLYYVGLDVSDYNHSFDPLSIADEYVVCTPDKFASAIAKFGRRFDAVISSHNIEHCDEPDATLGAIADVLKPGGLLFMAWPAEHTVNLPSRAGCLNFHDDPTHQRMPIFNDVLAYLAGRGVEPIFARRSYKPFIPWLIGAVLEPLSARLNRPAPFRSTWAFYGFESLVWLKNRAA